jgi:hypothetical protein
LLSITGVSSLALRRVSLSALTLGVALALCGCAALALPALAPLLGGGASGAVKAGTEYSKNGTVYRTFSLPFDRTHDAMLETLQRLDIKVIEEKRHDKGTVTIRAAAYGRRVTLGVEPVTPTMTRVHVAVGKGLGKDRSTASEIVEQADRTVEPEVGARTTRR